MQIDSSNLEPPVLTPNGEFGVEQVLNLIPITHKRMVFVDFKTCFFGQSNMDITHTRKLLEIVIQNYHTIYEQREQGMIHIQSLLTFETNLFGSEFIKIKILCIARVLVMLNLDKRYYTVLGWDKRFPFKALISNSNM